MNYVRVQKLQQTSELETLPIGYWIEGYLMETPQVGRRLQVDRRIRNGEEKRGFLTSSLVLNIVAQANGVFYLYTENSIYSVQYIEAPVKEKLPE